MAQRRDPTSYQGGRDAAINPVGPGGDVQGGRSIGDRLGRKYAPGAGAGTTRTPAPKPPKVGVMPARRSRRRRSAMRGNDPD